MTREVVVKTHKGRGKMPRCPTCHRPDTPLYLQVKGSKVLSGEYKCVSCQKLVDAIIRPPARPYNADIRDFLATHHEKYEVIYADPPWRFQEASEASSKSPERYYSTMSGEEIKTLPVQNIAEKNSILFMWGVATMTELAYEVMRSWGFIPEGQIIWEKISSNGKPRMGLGGKVRYSHELLLIGHRGKPEKAKYQTPSVITSKITKHSEKPELFWVLIENMFPTAKRIELFARKPRIGWTSVGNQIPVGEEMAVSVAENLT
jgi:N6-adenosine-specific RNA methylase IME4